MTATDDEAEAFARAILKAVEFSREMQASAVNGGLVAAPQELGGIPT